MMGSGKSRTTKKTTTTMRYFLVYDRVYHPPTGLGFPSSFARQPRRVPMPNDTVFGKLSARCLPTADLFGTDDYPAVEIPSV